MPASPRTLLHRTRIEEAELKIKSEEWLLAQSTYQPKLRKNTRMSALLARIYEVFSDHATLIGKPERIPATAFSFLEEYSNSTVNKAKKYLGIRSVRRNDVWWWTFPKRAPSEFEEKVRKEMVKDTDPYKEELSVLSRPASRELMAIMEEHNLVCTNTLALELMERAGYSRNTTLRMKAELGIISRKLHDQWCWLWANRPVQDWLEKQLAAGPVPHQQLALRAYEEHGWSFDLLLLARAALPSIIWTMDQQSRVGVWQDLNAAAHVAAEKGDKDDELVVDFSDIDDTRDHSNYNYDGEEFQDESRDVQVREQIHGARHGESLPQDSDRKIIVDFGGLGPDEDEPADQARSTRVIHAQSGVKIQVFE